MTIIFTYLYSNFNISTQQNVSLQNKKFLCFLINKTKLIYVLFIYIFMSCLFTYLCPVYLHIYVLFIYIFMSCLFTYSHSMPNSIPTSLSLVRLIYFYVRMIMAINKTQNMLRQSSLCSPK